MRKPRDVIEDSGVVHLPQLYVCLCVCLILMESFNPVPLITLITPIRAPMELCFDLARDIDLHVRSMAGTGERAVSGVTAGLIGFGQEVTWEATHFGIRQRLTSRISGFERPHYFRDSQVRGIFARFDHDHFFTDQAGITIMKDALDYQSPLGWLGRLVDFLVLQRYLRRLLQRRAMVIRGAAESQATNQQPR
jgi:ligand-binding SRPBCC domain-containing protein